MSILQDIFSDYYEQMIYELHPRTSVVENVNKMLHCGDPSYGGAMYGCPHCGNLKFVAFSCKSRFCPSCGNRYNQERSFHMSCKLVACVHRHCVFTIPEELRVYFLKDRTLLDCLFHSVRDVVFRMFSMMNKTENFTPGFICVLHTFGRDLKWNPHIHALISEGGAGNITPWRPVKHFDYNFLRNAFRKVLLEQLTSRIGPAFHKVKNEMYTKHTDGFMFVQSQIFALLISLLNTLADILEGLLLLPRASMIMTVKMSLFTTLVTKIIKRFPKPFLL